MTKIKIKKVESADKGYRTCCKGKLVLVKSNEYPLDKELYQGKGETDGKVFKCHSTEWNKSNGWAVTNPQRTLPIIISETETISKSDTCLDLDTDTIFEFSGDYKTSRAKKIIALPENFSSEMLGKIVDGKLKDGDEVLVRCTPECFVHEKMEGKNHCAYCAREWDVEYLNKISCREKENGEYEINLINNYIGLCDKKEQMIPFNKAVSLVAFCNNHWQENKYPLTLPMIEKWVKENVK